MGQQRNFSPTDLTDLIAVFETGSMTKAAELNERTKPAVSQTITRLERAVGFAILERPSWTVKFTERGEALVAKARDVMAELGSFSRLADVLAAGIESRISLAIDQAVPQERWLPAVKEVIDAYPNTKIELITANGNEGRDLVRGERSHAAIMLDYVLFSDHVDLEWHSIGEIEFADVCRVSATFHGKERPVSLPQIHVMNDANHSACQGSLRDVYVSSRDIQLSLILEGVGWGRLPVHLIADQLEGGKLIEFPQAPDMPFYPSAAICRAKNEHGPVAEFLWKALRRLG